MANQARSIPLAEYMRLIKPTDGMPQELRPVLFGLYGEVGSVMAASKKFHREREAYIGFRDAVVEEFGDVLWYFAAIGRRLNFPIDSIFAKAGEKGTFETGIVASDLVEWPLATANKVAPAPALDPALLKLGTDAAALLALSDEGVANAEHMMQTFAVSYVGALQASGMTFGEIAHHNATKTRGRFLEPEFSDLPTFDDEFDDEERIPSRFEIRITQRKSGKSYLQWNGVFIGDPLTDNIRDPDGYRFHDVFHLAHAAILHWSPVFRGLIKYKRKSSPEIDETQDGGRASVVEEGLTAWIFSQAKQTGFFLGQNRISFDMLKAIQQFVAGYEVERCPLNLWESAILQGYKAFLQVREYEGGILIGDRNQRTLTFKPLEPDESTTERSQ